MKTKLILLSICIMISITSFGQQNNKLKSGVYEFSKTNTSPEIDSILRHPDKLRAQVAVKFSTKRKFIVKNTDGKIVAHYSIGDFFQDIGMADAMQGKYLLHLQKNKNEYKANTKHIQLVIHIMDENKIEVKVLGGIIQRTYSGGQYYKRDVSLSPEKYTLTFVRALTAEDEKELK